MNSYLNYGELVSQAICGHDFEIILMRSVARQVKEIEFTTQINDFCTQ